MPLGDLRLVAERLNSFAVFWKCSDILLNVEASIVFRGRGWRVIPLARDENDATRETEGDSSNSPSSLFTADVDREEDDALPLFGDAARGSEVWVEEGCLECVGGDASALSRARFTPDSAAAAPRLVGGTSSSSRDLRFSRLGESGGEGGNVGGRGWRMSFKSWKFPGV